MFCLSWRRFTIDQFTQLIIVIVSIGASLAGLLTAVSLFVHSLAKLTEARASATTAAASAVNVNTEEHKLVLSLASGTVATVNHVLEMEKQNADFRTQISASVVTLKTYADRIDEAHAAITKNNDLLLEAHAEIKSLKDEISVLLRAQSNGHALNGKPAANPPAEPATIPEQPPQNTQVVAVPVLPLDGDGADPLARVLNDDPPTQPMPNLNKIVKPEEKQP